MPSVFRNLVLAFALAALVTAGPYPARSSGNSGATITFADNNRHGNRPRGGGTSVQFGESSLPRILSPLVTVTMLHGRTLRKSNYVLFHF